MYFYFLKIEHFWLFMPSMLFFVKKGLIYRITSVKARDGWKIKQLKINEREIFSTGSNYEGNQIILKYNQMIFFKLAARNKLLGVNKGNVFFKFKILRFYKFVLLTRKKKCFYCINCITSVKNGMSSI